MGLFWLRDTQQGQACSSFMGTVAEKYLQDRERRFEDFLTKSFENIDESQLHDLEIAEGIVFKVRPPDLEFYKAIGGLPLSFAEKLAQASADGAERAVAGLTQAEQMRLAALAAKMARYMCVEPRLVMGTPDNDNELCVDVITQGDLLKIVNFGKGGGASGLDTFRRGRPATALASANGKKLRDTAKPVTAGAE